MADINSTAVRGAKGKFESAKRSADKQSQSGNGPDFIDPDAAGNEAGEPGEPEARVKRHGGGWPKGVGRNPDGTAGAAKSGKAKIASLDLSALGGALQAVHATIAFARSEQHWLLNDDESKKYGIALGNALRHLPIETTQKGFDFFALGMMMLSIETPRVVKSAQNRRNPNRGAAPRGPAQVFQFHPPENSPFSGMQGHSGPQSPANPPPPAAASPANPPSPSRESPPPSEPPSPPAPMVEPDFSDTLGGP